MRKIIDEPMGCGRIVPGALSFTCGEYSNKKKKLRRYCSICLHEVWYPWAKEMIKSKKGGKE